MASRLHSSSNEGLARSFAVDLSFATWDLLLECSNLVIKNFRLATQKDPDWQFNGYLEEFLIIVIQRTTIACVVNDAR